MNRLIIDVEATCTDSDEFPRHESEIIEIGAVLLNENNKTVDIYEQFVKPVRNPILTDFCNELTTITQNDVDNGMSFDKAMEDLESWVYSHTCVQNDSFTFCSWGGYDKNQFNRDAEFHGITNFLNRVEHVNIKKQFGKSQQVKPCGMKKALNLSKLKLIGTLHRGVDDAINMAALIPWIDGTKKIPRP